jgi:hypothetical protein
MKTLLTDTKPTERSQYLKTCSCGGIPSVIESRQNGRFVTKIVCHSCNKSTPDLLRDVAIKFWNHYDVTPRSLEYNEWGVCISRQDQTVVESHGKNTIKIRAYLDGGRWFYAYAIQIGSLVRSKQPTILDQTYDSLLSMKLAAKNELKKLCEYDRKTKKLFLDFTIISYNQLDLFSFNEQHRNKEY